MVRHGMAQKSIEEDHIMVCMRMIGHEVLLSAGDSTSRVLPITKKEGRYIIQFESEFQFVPDELVATINRVIDETELDHSYIVSVEECDSGKVVYSYEMGNLYKPNIIPCQERMQPTGCYSLLITLLDPYGGVISPPTDSTSTQEGDTKDNAGKRYTILAVPVVLLVVLVLMMKKKKPTLKTNPNLIALGDYQFDKLNTELLYKETRTELSGKEADLLLLLYGSVNTTVERQVILNKVWGDDGDYVGRTLDVFISKLRKKLEVDPKVKIVNIRGVGYKLVVNA